MVTQLADAKAMSARACDHEELDLFFSPDVL